LFFLDPSAGFIAMRDFCDLSFLIEEGLLQSDKRRHDHARISEALLKKRNVCAPQIARVLHLIKWLEAVNVEAKQEVRLEIKKRLYKENSADIEQDQIKETLQELWMLEEASFNATLLRLKLIN
jgi:hypothetical protein